MEINFVTSNPGKVKEIKAILGEKVQVNHIEMEYREMRSDQSEEIAKESAERLSKELNKTIMVEDSGLFIKELKEFPGTCSSYIHKRIGLNGILKLMENIVDRSCVYRSAVSYCEPGKNAISFVGEETGSISNEIRGNHGFGHDPIFIPEGSEMTYGEQENCENLKRFRKMAVDKLKNHLKKEEIDDTKN